MKGRYVIEYIDVKVPVVVNAGAEIEGGMGWREAKRKVLEFWKTGYSNVRSFRKKDAIPPEEGVSDEST